MINWFLPKTKVHLSRRDRSTFTINSQLRAKWTISKKALGSYSEDLAHSNWMILLQGMFRKGQSVLVKFDFPNSYFLLTYLLTYLKVINPKISGAAAAIITKLYGPNTSPLGSKLFQFGQNRKMFNTTFGTKCSKVGQRLV